MISRDLYLHLLEVSGIRSGYLVAVENENIELEGRAKYHFSSLDHDRLA
jgi:hypothetical protein